MATSDCRFKIRDFAPTGAGGPKISGRRGRHRFFFLFVTLHTFDRQTDRQTEFSSLDRVCVPCSVVKGGDCDVLQPEAARHHGSLVTGFNYEAHTNLSVPDL